MPFDEHGVLVGPGDITKQTEQVFSNVEAALDAAGARLTDVVKMTYFVTDGALLPQVRAVRDRHIDTRHPPTSSAIQVSALVHPEFLVEIEAVAVIDHP